MPIRIACHTIGWVNASRDYTVAEVVRQIRDAGYDGIEFFEPLDKLGREEDLKKILDASGMILVSLSNGLNMNTKEQNHAWDKINYAHKFGSKVVMLCCGFIGDGHEKTDRDTDILAGKLNEIEAYASKFGMYVAYHPHLGTFVETKEDIEKLLSKSRYAKICLDTAHLKAAGSDPEEIIDRWPDKIVYVHLKDWNSDKKRFVELGSGDAGLDFKRILRKLESIGYDGWATVEQDIAGSSPFESAKKSRNFLRSIGY